MKHAVSELEGALPLLEAAAEKVLTGKEHFLTEDERQALRQHLAGTLRTLRGRDGGETVELP